MHHWNRALITGASSGIGEAIARRLAHRGTSLVLVARREERLRQFVAEFGGTGHEVLVADLTDATARDRVARRLAASAEPIDLLVNNAGFGVAGRFHERTTDEVQAQLDVLVTTVLELTHAAVPGMVSRGTGGVLNVSSLAANVPFILIQRFNRGRLLRALRRPARTRRTAVPPVATTPSGTGLAA